MNATEFRKWKPRITRINADSRILKSALIREIRGHSSGCEENVAAEEAEDAEDADFSAGGTIRFSAPSAVISSRPRSQAALGNANWSEAVLRRRGCPRAERSRPGPARRHSLRAKHSFAPIGIPKRSLGTRARNRKPRIARINADFRTLKSALIRAIRGQSSGCQANVAADETEDAEYADYLAGGTINSSAFSASSASSAAISSRTV